MRTAVMTMAYNEGVVLPLWVKYYGRLFGRENLFVIDHGSDDGSTEDLSGINLIRLPRTPFSDIIRSNMISDLCANLLKFYDYFVYTDTDEFLCVDPTKHGDLSAYLMKERPDYVTAIGMNVFHCYEDEPSLNQTRPILSQRSYAYFMPPMCKTLITHLPLKWGGGFHACDQPQNFTAVYNMHLKQMDRDIALDRLRVLRSIPRDGNFGTHQTIEDEKMELVFSQVNSRQRIDSFDFKDDVQELTEHIKKNHAGKYVFDVDYRSRNPTHLRKIPSQFKGVL